MKILIAGDFVPQDRVSRLMKMGDMAKVFSDLPEIINNADFSIVNLEAPIISGDGKKIDKAGPNISAPIETIDALKYLGFNGVTLANNHLRDYGRDGVNNTIQLLRNNAFYVFGAGANIEEASKTVYVDYQDKKIGIINCCEHEYSIANDFEAGSNPLNPISQFYAILNAKHKADYVLVIVHGGIERYNLPTPQMQQIYRFFIDAGADAIVNHHQHCFSGYEIYHNRPIFYGLGNFCFDWPEKSNQQWCSGYMVNIEFDKKIKFDLIPYEQCFMEPKIKILEGKDKSVFMYNIEELNKIIASPKILEDAYYSLLEKTHRNYKALFSPYSNRILQSLYIRNLIPGFMTKKKWHAIKNKIECESHRDRLLDMINRQLKG